MSRLDDILLLIGRLNYTWTNTESLFIYLTALLLGTSKEAAVVVFLTLNTTRARLDLIERLAKIKDVSPETRQAILAITTRLKRQAKLRNKYNHCIYSFDQSGQISSTQLMRVAEFGNDLRYGKVESLDNAEIARIHSAITEVAAVNREIWRFLGEKGVAA